MKNLLHILFFLFTVTALGQSDSLNLRGRIVFRNYTDTVTGFSYIPDITYGSNVDWVGVTKTLKLDVYKPLTTSGTKKFPLYIWIHGGGWVNGDKREGPTSETTKYLNAMALAGYVVVSPNYRLGWIAGADCADCDSVTGMKAVYRSVQDLKAVARFLVANAATYNIDTSHIFMGGSSAGSGTTLHLQYAPQSFFPPSYIAEMGYLDSATNNLTNTFRLSGIVSQWGGIADTALITPSNVIPLLVHHGLLDELVTPYIDHQRFCANLPIIFGAIPIHNRTTNLGVTSETYIKNNGHHVCFSSGFWTATTIKFFDDVIQNRTENTLQYF